MADLGIMFVEENYLKFVKTYNSSWIGRFTMIVKSTINQNIMKISRLYVPFILFIKNKAKIS
jgi:hypothetical protein